MLDPIQWRSVESSLSTLFLDFIFKYGFSNSSQTNVCNLQICTLLPCRSQNKKNTVSGKTSQLKSPWKTHICIHTHMPHTNTAAINSRNTLCPQSCHSQRWHAVIPWLIYVPIRRTWSKRERSPSCTT